MRRHPDLTADWNIAWDDRGHFSEPHTGHEIGLGTLAVRSYIERLRDPRDPQRRHLRRRRQDQGAGGPLWRGAVPREGRLHPDPRSGQDRRALRPRDHVDQGHERHGGAHAGRGAVRHSAGSSCSSCTISTSAGFSIKQTLVDQQPPLSIQARDQLHRPRIEAHRRRGARARARKPIEPSQGSEDALAKRLRINGATAEGDRLPDRRASASNSTPCRRTSSSPSSSASSPNTASPRSSRRRKRWPRPSPPSSAARWREKALKAELARLNAEPVERPADLDARVRAYLEDNREETWDAAVREIVGEDGA